MRLSHNMASLNIYKEQSKILQKQGTSLERISSGYKVNKTKDNPEAMSQSERIRMQIRGVQMAARNVQDGISMLQTAEGALGSINDIMLRVRELTVQAANGTNTAEDKNNIQTEIGQMLQGIDDIANNTEFNGVKLLAHQTNLVDPNLNKLSMPTGANVDEKVDIPMFDLRSSSITDGNGNTLSSIDVTKPGGANSALKTIDEVTDKILSVNSQYGALENRFDSAYNNLNEIGDKMEGADGSIRDADIAEEMMELSKNNLLVDAGNAMMVQTNKFPQDVLRILENIRR